LGPIARLKKLFGKKSSDNAPKINQQDQVFGGNFPAAGREEVYDMDNRKGA
jgi:hypothetical protein